MKSKYMCLGILLITSLPCFASAPSCAKITNLHEKIISRDDESELEIEAQFYVSAKVNAEPVGSFAYSFKNNKKKKGVIDLIELNKGFRNFGYGTAWFKRAVIELTTLGAKTISWKAQPLDEGRRFSRPDLADLLRFYTRHGAIVIKKHIDKQHNHIEMQYPMALAYALSILHPIFVTQEKSPLLEKARLKTKKGKHYTYKQEDPFKLILDFANIDLENTNLKPKEPAGAARANTLLQIVDSASIELL